MGRQQLQFAFINILLFHNYTRNLMSIVNHSDTTETYNKYGSVLHFGAKLVTPGNVAAMHYMVFWLRCDEVTCEYVLHLQVHTWTARSTDLSRRSYMSYVMCKVIRTKCQCVWLRPQMQLRYGSAHFVISMKRFY